MTIRPGQDSIQVTGKPRFIYTTKDHRVNDDFAATEFGMHRDQFAQITFCLVAPGKNAFLFGLFAFRQFYLNRMPKL